MYFGKVKPTETTSSVLRSTYTGNGSTTTYALPGPVANETSIIATINGVTQQDAAYSTDGSNIIFDAAPALNDAIELRTISAVGLSYAPYAGSVTTGILADDAVTTKKINDGAITSAKIAAGAVVQADIGANVVGTGPAFQVYGASDVTISNNGVAYVLTFTKPGDQNDFDTNTYYNTSTNRYTPLVAGWYFFSVSAVLNNISSGYVQVNINKNGNIVRSFRNFSGTNEYFGVGGSAMVYCNGTTDYIDTTIQSSADSSATVHNGSVRNFCGYLVRNA